MRIFRRLPLSTRATVFASLVALTACGGAGGSAPASQDSTPAASPPAQAPAGESSTPSAAAATSSSSASQASVPEASPKPKFREVVVPAGTTLRVRMMTAVASDTSAIEDPVRATLESPVRIGGATAIPADAEVTGTVTSVQRSGKVKGRASLSFRFDRLSAWDARYELQSARVSRQARATKRKDATKIGVGAGAGAVVGAIVGGGKGAAIGSAVGGGAGTGVVLATRGEEVRVPAGTVVNMKLDAPLTVQVPID